MRPDRGFLAKPSHLLSPLYMAAVAGLAVNDHILKGLAPGVVTGKLSDFLGLFAFAVFLSVVFPRWTNCLHAAVAAAFVAWKSPAADGLIHVWNATMPLATTGTILAFAREFGQPPATPAKS